MDLNNLIQETLIDGLKKDGLKLFYDAMDDCGNRIELEVTEEQRVHDYMNTHYQESEEWEEAKQDKEYQLVAYIYDSNDEKKDIVCTSCVVEYEKYDNPAADMHNRI